MTTTSTTRREVTEGEKDTTINALALALGEGWRVGDDANAGKQTRSVRHADGYGCTLYWQSYPAGRIEIGGVYPRTADGAHLHPSSVYGTSTPSITVSAERPAREIANEIKRRFLPAYLPVYQQLQARAASTDEYARLTAETARKVVTALGGRLGTRSDNQNSIWLEGNRAYSVTAQGADVRIEAFSCKADLAIAILILLGKEDEAGR